MFKQWESIAFTTLPSSLSYPKISVLIFVTGGTGFLGTHLLRELVQRGERVRALRRSSSRVLLEKKFSSEVEWVEGDVLDVATLDDRMQGCTEVYHAAAIVRFMQKDYARLMKVNVEGTANVVNAALNAGVKKLVHVSSVAAIGRSRNDVLVNEDTAWEEGKNNSNYAVSKFLAEREVWRGTAEGLEAVIVNPSLILGSGHWEDGPPEFFTRVNNGLRVYTGGGTGIVAVGDVVALMITLMKSPVVNERFILSAENWSFKDLFFTIADALRVRRPNFKVANWMMEILWREEMLRHFVTGKKPLVTRETARIARHWSRFDNTKILTATGFRFTPVNQCISETAQLFQAMHS
jgi:nucleoside-diphosphate-sugar epimerase